MDPFLSLLWRPAATTTLRVGTGVALPLEHDVFALAKSVATLDRLSAGRFDFGVGVGWNVEELADHRPDVPWPSPLPRAGGVRRGPAALWTDDEAEHHGRWFDFDPVWAEPKPRQAPHPPIVGGMAGRLGTEHVVAWADDVDADGPRPWQRRQAHRPLPLRRWTEAAGRRCPIILGAWGDPSRTLLLEYAELGIDQVVLGAARQGWDDPSTALPFIERYAALVPELHYASDHRAARAARRSVRSCGRARRGSRRCARRARDALGHGRLRAREADGVPGLAHQPASGCSHVTNVPLWMNCSSSNTSPGSRIGATGMPASTKSPTT